MIEAGNITARDLMITGTTSISSDATLRDARRALLDLSPANATPKVLVVVGDQGEYLGLITARLLIKSLLSTWMPNRSTRQDADRLEAEMLDAVAVRSSALVREALVGSQPTVAPGDRLHVLIELACDKRIECLAVIDEGKPVGIIPMTSVVRAAASLALRPDDAGIQVDGKKYT